MATKYVVILSDSSGEEIMRMGKQPYSESQEVHDELAERMERLVSDHRNGTLQITVERVTEHRTEL